MVDAIGGVEVCVQEEIHSPKANNLHLEPGLRELDGAKALDYARARIGKGLGDGSDIKRIERQQHLLGATVNKVLSKNLLTQQVDLYRFLDAATRSLAADEKFASIPTLAGLAYSLRSIKGSQITFMTPKLADYAPDPNRVIFADGVDEIWEKLARDEPIKEPKKPKPSSSASPDGEPTKEPSPNATTDDGTLTPDDVAALCG
jgi:anionic cell wall polymer biosynthesis LytR-Cps2A-Psr (LCP) family protein